MPETIKTKINKLKSLRKTDEILFYFTSDKQPVEAFGANIANDVIPILYKHLSKIGKKNKITLFLYSSGGSLESPWPIVSLLREYCDELEVVIPFKALSAATLICLGADKILMTPTSYLSPIDPQGRFQIGGTNRSIQVEDVTGFISFAKKRVGLAEQKALTETMRFLSSEIPPSVIGSVNRTHHLIRLLAEKLLRLHKKNLDKSQTKLIVKHLTEKLYAHNHLINRREAMRDIGFGKIITYATAEEELLVNDIFNEKSKDLKLTIPFEAEKLFEGQEISNGLVKTFSLKRALISSSTGTDAFVGNYQVVATLNTPNPIGFNVSPVNAGWKEE